MREIKFRAWDVEGKYMITSAQAIANILKKEILGYPEKGLDGEGGNYSNGHSKRGDRVLMQFTGLKDKNGKEIYEGDICETAAWNLPVQIFWDGRNCGFEMRGGKDFVESIHESDDFEVIGNIYKNPELLK